MNLLLAGDFSPAEQTAWLHALRQALPAHRVLSQHNPQASSALIDAAIVANPAPGSLAGLPGLRLIQSLWAGVDRLLADATLPPGVPIARMVDPAMNAAMAETALWAALALHRGFFNYARQQAQGLWQSHAQRRADEVTVLVLGHGEMGRAVALRLAQQGYTVSAWRRAPSGQGASGNAAGASGSAAGAEAAVVDASADRPTPVQVLSGPAALAGAMSSAQVVINLLPLTPQTRGLINAEWLARLPRGSGLVNLARGAQVVDDDLLAALDTGQLSHAVLDVFHTEPLPASHRYWAHPKVTVLPHAAAQTDARSAAAVVARNIEALASGAPLQHLVQRAAGY